MIQHVKTLTLAVLIAGVFLTKVYADKSRFPDAEVAKASIVELG